MTGLFTPEQLNTLKAAIDRIVPKDEYPSATEAGCLDFLLRLIPLEGQVEYYQTGLNNLDLAARKRGQYFSSMTSAEQDNLLRDIDSGKTTMQPKDFVDTLARQTIEGYYANPENGGNKDGIAWEMIGFKVKN